MIPIFVVVYFVAVFTVGCTPEVVSRIDRQELAHSSVARVAPVSQQGALSFSDVLRLADASSSRADEAGWNMRMQEARIEEARADYFPSVDASVTTGGRGEGQGGETVGSITVSQSVFDFGKTTRTVDLERATAKLKQSQQVAISDSAIYASGHLAIEMLRRKDKQTICQKKINESERLRNLVRKRTNDGASAAADLVQAEAHVQAARAELLVLKREQRLLAARLAVKLGGEARMPVISRFENSVLLTACGQSGTAMSPSAKIAEAEAALRVAEASASLADVEGRPKMTLEGKMHGALQRGRGSDPRYGDPRYGIGIKLSGDLVPWMRSSARRKHAAFGIEAALSARQAAMEDQDEAWSQAKISAASLAEMDDVLSMRVKLAEKKRGLFEMQYLNAGSRSLFDLLSADDEVAKMWLAQVDLKSDQLVAGLDCLHRSGQLGVAFSVPRLRA